MKVITTETVFLIILSVCSISCLVIISYITIHICSLSQNCCITYCYLNRYMIRNISKNVIFHYIQCLICFVPDGYFNHVYKSMANFMRDIPVKM